jgi:FKBP-type peptidyl-prolyl cis-trans isomerase
MKKFLFILPFLALAACGDDAEVDDREPVKLETFEDKLSYAFGAMEAKKITESTNPNSSRLDKAMLLEGFKDGFKTGLSKDPASPCMKSMEGLFGAQGMDFDTTYLKEGSRCYGLTMAGMFYEQLEGVSEQGNINKELLYRGFEDALAGNDTVLSQEDKLAVIDQFSEQIRTRMMKEQEEKLVEIEITEAAEWEKIKAMPGIQELENGIYLKTLKKGSGASPVATDDVEASYILSDLKGDVKQNSADFGQNLKRNLQGVVKGWTIGFQSMQKGGRYMLYVPGAMGYGAETLVFEVELFDFGPAGSIAPAGQQ